MNKRWFLFIFFVAFHAQVFSTVIETMDMNHLVFCTFSSVYQNRISVVGGAVQKVMYSEGNIQFTLEETSGQVFVYSLVEYPQKTTVSLVLHDGTVQDLELDFKKKSSEVLVLQYPEKQEEPPLEKKDHIGVLKEILEGRVLSGYIAKECSNINRNLTRNVTAELNSKLVGADDIVYIWGIENGSRSRAKLCEQVFSQPDVNWVYLDKNCLGCREKTFAVVSVKR